MKIKQLLLLTVIVFSLSSCSYRLVDFTVISSKNVSLDFDKSEGKQVEGKKSYFLGLGWNIKDAMDRALESAGPEYDLLVDGVVKYTDYPFVLTISVEGTAISSRAMRNKLGDAGFQEWLKENQLTYNSNTEEITTDN
ncbi:hypothetical protein LB452_06335 [Psychroflexus sp. CAK8W]|uniref:Lipoprotein n=1 Tax=Psychroflexus longus TaxID=2873596 RepID=A0ABS7XHU8_9FLAO|nr:hypothetical protein [Psychroflexus longus]MBZ9778537.1 hypothetical protein [Psychroflexus longus]